MIDVGVCCHWQAEKAARGDPVPTPRKRRRGANAAATFAAQPAAGQSSANVAVIGSPAATAGAVAGPSDAVAVSTFDFLAAVFCAHVLLP